MGIHTGQMLQDILGLRKVWKHSALEPMRLERWLSQRWLERGLGQRRLERRLSQWWFSLAYSSRLAAELLLSGPSHRLLLLQPSQGALLQRPWPLRGLHHSLSDILAVLMNSC